MEFDVAVDYRVKMKEIKMIDKYLMPIVVGALGNKNSSGIENQRKNQNNTDYSITKIGQNTEENPEDLTKLTQTISIIFFFYLK